MTAVTKCSLFNTIRKMFSCKLFLKIPLMTSHKAQWTLPCPFSVLVNSSRPVLLMPLPPLSWYLKLLCLSALYVWDWPRPASLVSFTFLLLPQWVFSVFDVSSVHALVALGLFSGSSPLSKRVFKMVFEYLIHHLVVFVPLFSLSLCFPTWFLQPN